MQISRTDEAIRIMLDFAERTGLSSDRPARRYLWTDAFAVCNFLGLHAATQEGRFKTLAVRLIDQVHDILGRHRGDDPRTGWISGLPEAEGRAHPLAGGLRIGKRLNERGPGEQPDSRLEWDQDGQYFHYLTKWMHALMQAGAYLDAPHYIVWAAELAEVAFDRFVHEPAPGRARRMYWKMRIDLSAPLVASMGQHDPLDGLVTSLSLKARLAARPLAERQAALLDRQISEYSRMCRDMAFETNDPLGLGGILTDALRLAQVRSAASGWNLKMIETLLEAAGYGLRDYVSTRPLARPAAGRLAFRELGLALGLTAMGRLPDYIDDAPDPGARAIRQQLKILHAYAPQARAIEETWLAPANQQAASWTDHLDINAVMLATCLAPDGYLSAPAEEPGVSHA